MIEPKSDLMSLLNKDEEIIQYDYLFNLSLNIDPGVFRFSKETVIPGDVKFYLTEICVTAFSKNRDCNIDSLLSFCKVNLCINSKPYLTKQLFTDSNQCVIKTKLLALTHSNLFVSFIRNEPALSIDSVSLALRGYLIRKRECPSSAKQ